MEADVEGWKEPVAALFKRHGYTEFQGPDSAIANKGSGPFGEHLAVARSRDRFNFFVRRGGEAAVRQIVSVVEGGTIEGSALAFRDIDFAQLEVLMDRVVRRIHELG
jgi:hypothetical protein